MTQKRTRTFGLALLLLLAGFVLAACSAADIPPLATGDESLNDIQSTAPQASNSDAKSVATDWDAAAFFAAACASCHGPTGQGTAVAPALNREAIQTASTDWLVETISNGRSGTAMPAWSVEFGGPLTSDQIADMAAFLQAGNWDKAGEIAADQPVSPMRPGMMEGQMGGGMMGRGRMGGGMGNGRHP